MNIFYTGLIFLIVGCASNKVSEYDLDDGTLINQEYDRMVKINEIPAKDSTKEAPVVAAEEKSKPVSETKVQTKAAPIAKGAVKVNDKKAVEAPKENLNAKLRMPEIEDGEGFIGRRPIVDPFHVGEKVEMSVTYFNMAAGLMTLEVKPFVQVNGRKSYHFSINVESSKMFNYFYSVSDQVDTFMDFEDLTPSSFSVKIVESKQLKDIRSFFDFKTLKGTYWEKKVTKEKGEQNKKKEWNVLPYTQNVMSVLFYLRFFTMVPGKTLTFRVADAGENMVFSAKVLRKEKIKTELGMLDTVVLQPKIEVDGIFKQMGDIFIWLTDDDRKFPVRIDSKIKIGTVITKVKAIKK